MSSRLAGIFRLGSKLTGCHIRRKKLPRNAGSLCFEEARKGKELMLGADEPGMKLRTLRARPSCQPQRLLRLQHCRQLPQQLMSHRHICMHAPRSAWHQGTAAHISSG